MDALERPETNRRYTHLLCNVTRLISKFLSIFTKFCPFVDRFYKLQENWSQIMRINIGFDFNVHWEIP